MSNLPFTLRQLEVFERLCELKSFRATSEALRVSQASVSNQIKVLEGQLGLKLFDRPSGKTPTLTREGAEFLADVVHFREAAMRLASHRRKNQARENKESITIRFFVSQYLFNRLIRPNLAIVLEQSPNVDLRISSDHYDHSPSDYIWAAGHDFILVHEDLGAKLHPNSKIVAQAPGGVFGHKKFLNGLSSPITVEEVSDLPFVLPPEGSFFENHVLSNLAKVGIKPNNVVARAQHFDVMCNIIDAGKAVGGTLHAIFSPEQRENVVMLYPSAGQRLVLYRHPGCLEPDHDLFEKFVISSALADPAYIEA